MGVGVGVGDGVGVGFGTGVGAGVGAGVGVGVGATGAGVDDIGPVPGAATGGATLPPEATPPPAPPHADRPTKANTLVDEIRIFFSMFAPASFRVGEPLGSCSARPTPEAAPSYL